MKAFIIREKFKNDIVDAPMPILGEGEVLLQVKYVGLCGSDLNTYRGANPLITLPRIPGHEISAVIAEKGLEVPEQWRIGQQVTVSPYTNCGACPSCYAERPNCCQYNRTLGVQRDGALTEFIKAPWQKLFDADGIEPAEIALIEPLTVGGHAADRSGATEDSVVAIFGCGAVGLGTVLGVAQKGARKVIAVDIDDEKLALAKKFGATDTVNSSRDDLHAALSEITGDIGPNIIIEAVGLPQTFRTAVDEVAFAGGVTYIGYAKAPVEYDTKYFVQKELNIQGSRNAMPVNFRRTLDLARRNLIPLKEMISGVYGFHETGKALEDWHRNPGSVCRYLIKI